MLLCKLTFLAGLAESYTSQFLIGVPMTSDVELYSVEQIPLQFAQCRKEWPHSEDSAQNLYQIPTKQREQWGQPSSKNRVGSGNGFYDTLKDNLNEISSEKTMVFLSILIFFTYRHLCWILI